LSAKKAKKSSCAENNEVWAQKPVASFFPNHQNLLIGIIFIQKSRGFRDFYQSFSFGRRIKFFQKFAGFGVSTSEAGAAPAAGHPTSKRSLREGRAPRSVFEVILQPTIDRTKKE